MTDFQLLLEVVHSENLAPETRLLELRSDLDIQNNDYQVETPQHHFTDDVEFGYRAEVGHFLVYLEQVNGNLEQDQQHDEQLKDHFEGESAFSVFMQVNHEGKEAKEVDDFEVVFDVDDSSNEVVNELVFGDWNFFDLLDVLILSDSFVEDEGDRDHEQHVVQELEAEDAVAEVVWEVFEGYLVDFVAERNHLGKLLRTLFL